MHRIIGIITAGCLFSQALSAQKAFVVKGDLKDTAYDGQKANLSYLENGAKVYKTATIKDGKFVMEGTVTDPALVTISTGTTKKAREANPFITSEQLSFFMEGGEIIITGPTMKKAVVKASGRSAQDYQALKKILKPFEDKQAANFDQTIKAAIAKDTATVRILNATRDRLTKSVDSAEVAYLTTHPASHVSLELIRQRVNAITLTKDKDKMKAWYTALSAPVKATVVGKQLSEQISTAFKLGPGNPSRDFTLNDTLGNPVTLSAYRGKYVLVDFWASWCMPCRAENPAVKKAYAKFKDKGFEVIGISLERPGDRKSWVGAIQKDDLPWIQTSPLTAEERDHVTKLYGITSIPMNFLIDPQGKIIATYLRGEELMTKLEEIL